MEKFDCYKFLLSVSLHLLFLISHAFSQSVVQTSPGKTQIEGVRKTRVHTKSLCDSWRFSVETNNAGKWKTVPSSCVTFVEKYMNGGHYLSDSIVVSGYSLAFAKSINVSSDGKDGWVFDVDETLLSGLPYYKNHGYGSEIFDEDAYNEWVALANAPALPASLKLYKELQQLGFKIFLLTGRSEFQRNITSKNLLIAGFSDWEKLILRGASDQGKSATVYKSEKRLELVKKEGYRIRGSSGDQWSDLFGFAKAERSFKLPNPMYYIS